MDGKNVEGRTSVVYVVLKTAQGEVVMEEEMRREEGSSVEEKQGETCFKGGYDKRDEEQAEACEVVGDGRGILMITWEGGG